MDIEASYVDEGPGLRIFVDEQFRPRIELKWADKPTWRAAQDIVLPRNQWFSLELRATLDDGKKGAVRLLLNDRTIIKSRGQTLPFSEAVYDRLELGITANNKGADCVVFVDDLHYKKE